MSSMRSHCLEGNTVVHANTTLSEQVKFSALTQEVVRRLLHTSRRLPEGVIVECLETLSQKMANSDHRCQWFLSSSILNIKSFSFNKIQERLIIFINTILVKL